MKTSRLTGRVLFGNILKPKSYNSSLGKFDEDPRGTFQLTLIVDETHPDYNVFKEIIEQKKAEIMETEKFKKLSDVKFYVKDKQHTDKEGNLIDGKRQITLKRNAINKNNEAVSIDIFNRMNEIYRPESEIGYGSDVQVAFVVGDSYIPKDNVWYLTLYLLAVMIEQEATSSYGFVAKAPSITDDEVAKQFDGEVVEPTPPPKTDNDLPF